MPHTTQHEPGRALAERLGLSIVRQDGRDLRVACVHHCGSEDNGHIDIESGVYGCWSCGKGLSAFDLSKVVLRDHERAKRLMIDVGLFEDRSNGNGHATPSGKPAAATADNWKPAPPTADDEAAFLRVCEAKRMPPASVKAYGGVPYKGGVRVPMWGPDLKVCSHIHITPENGKGLYSKGKPTGLFFPSQSPEPGERWLIVEGPKDSPVLRSLGYTLTAGLPGNHLHEKFAPLFKGVNVVVIPDCDRAGIQGALTTAANLKGVAASVKIALLPGEVGESNGADVRDVLKEYGDRGPDAIRKAIDEALTPEEVARRFPAKGGAGELTEPIDFGIITAAELLRRDCSVEFLIPRVLAKGQHHILGGPLKCCKSLIATDLAVSLAMGGKFLDHFQAARPVRTILLSGESGWPVFQENIRRISQARGATEGQLENLLTGVRLPKFGNPLHQDTLCTYIISQKAEAVILDCAYRCIPGDFVSNQFAMGEVLDSIGNALESVGATLILLCHTPKHVAPGEPLELDNLAFAGFSEFAAQWLIVNRQKTYEPGSGRHFLWAVVGGRAGHSGTYALDLDEGEFRQGEDREWRVAVTRADEARKEQRGQRDQERAAKRAEKIEEIKKRILNAAAKYRSGETPTAIRDRAGLHDREFKPALVELLDGGDLLSVEIIKRNRKAPYQGYILASYQTTQG
jgi:hypothetical protein